ncbi:MAG: antibiotic biosynthesis monooxygenase, partial [Cyanobacteria bacterium P01_E01_bin.6]
MNNLDVQNSGCNPLPSCDFCKNLKILGLLRALYSKGFKEFSAPPRAGCIQYDLHEDNENPAHFVFYENWE